MRILGWGASGVGVAFFSLRSRVRKSIPWLRPKVNGRNEEIRSAVEFAVGLNALADLERSFIDYTKSSKPANVLMHYATTFTLVLLFARIKNLGDRETREAVEMVLVHDSFEPLRKGGDRPHYNRARLPKRLPQRLLVLSRKRPPRNEEELESRKSRHERYLPFMEKLTEGLEPSFQEWVLERFRQFYLDDTPQAQLARMCDRLSDAFFAPWYVKLGEKMDDFLKWARYRSRHDDDLHEAVRFLETYFETAPK